MCVFCEINKDLLLEETEYSRLLINYFPLGRLALLVIPKRHVHLITDLSAEELTDLILLYQSAIRTINGAIGSPALLGWFNQGEKAGQTIPHFHLHIAIYEDGGNLKKMERIGEKIPISDNVLQSIKRLFE
jgi:diadenosine tetraphosphate (Ap4A) HIT family hydrolase